VLMEAVGGLRTAVWNDSPDALAAQRLHPAGNGIEVGRHLASNCRHLPFHPPHGPRPNTNDPRHLEDAVTGIKVLPDGVLGPCYQSWGDRASYPPL